MYFLHPERKHCMTLGKRSHYIAFVPTDKQSVSTADENIKKLLHQCTERNAGTKIQLYERSARELAWALHMQKVKVVRDSYYGEKYSDAGKLFMMIHVQQDLDPTVIKVVKYNDKIRTSQVTRINDTLLALVQVKPLFVRPEKPIPYTDMHFVSS